MIITISGASGVGKTTIIEALSNYNNPNIRLFHFDDIGMPDWSTITDTQKWQRDTTLAWMDKIIEIATAENTHVILEGSTAMKFYKEGFEKHNFTDFEIILFDCEKKVMKERLIERGQPELYTEDMVNWANHLRTNAIANQYQIIRTDHHDIHTICTMIMHNFT